MDSQQEILSGFLLLQPGDIHLLQTAIGGGSQLSINHRLPEGCGVYPLTEIGGGHFQLGTFIRIQTVIPMLVTAGNGELRAISCSSFKPIRIVRLGAKCVRLELSIVLQSHLHSLFQSQGKGRRCPQTCKRE